MGISGVRIDENEIINAIRVKKGVIRHAAEYLQCDPNTIYSAMIRNPEVARIVHDERTKADLEERETYREADSRILKKAYQSIEELCEEKDVTATIFALKCKAKWKQDHNESNNKQPATIAEPTLDTPA